MKVTIKDIAAATGLSTASVSRILNQRGRYSAASAKRVHDAAADLGYFKNRSAADLASQRNHTIGVINYPAETNANDQVIQGIMAEANRLAMDVMIMYAARDDQAVIAKTVQNMIERRVFAVMFLSVRPDQAIIDTLRRANIYPQEVASASASDLNISSISSDDFQIGFKSDIKRLISCFSAAIGMLPLPGLIRSRILLAAIAMPVIPRLCSSSPPHRF